jgi:hypothetical protein
LTNDHKIGYYNPETNEKRGQITLTTECSIMCDSDKKFELQTPKRLWQFEPEERNAKIWAEIIKKELNRLK